MEEAEEIMEKIRGFCRNGEYLMAQAYAEALGRALGRLAGNAQLDRC